jgi:hypothetical protein
MDQANPEHDSIYQSDDEDNNQAPPFHPPVPVPRPPPNTPNRHTPVFNDPAPRAPKSIKRIPVSDYSNISKIEEPLNTKLKNWTRWSQSMYIMMRVIRVIGYVEGTIARPDPDQDEEGAENWDFNDSFVVMLIAQNISASERTHIKGSETSQNLWEKLMKIHQSTSYQVQSQRVKQLWLSHINEDNDIPQQLVKITQVWKKIIQFSDEGQYTNQQLQ